MPVILKPIFYYSPIIAFFLTINLYSQNNDFTNAIENYEKSVHLESSDVDSSQIYARRAYEILKPRDTLNQTYTDILNQLGRLKFHKRDYLKAYDYFNRCYKISLATGEEQNAYKVKVNMALCQRQLNNTTKALEDLFEVVKYFEESDKTNINLGKTYVNIADLYMLNKQHEFADTYYQKSLVFFNEDENLYLQLTGNRIANFNSYDIDKSLEVIKEIESNTNLDSLPAYISAPLYNSMAQTMVKTENYKKGLAYTFKGLKVKKIGGLKIGLAIQYNNIGDIYIKTKNYAFAITYLDSALQLAETHRQKFQILKNLQNAHKANNNLEKSLLYANKYIALKDSTNEVLTQTELAELGVKYESEEKDKFIEQLKNLSNVYKILLILFVLLSIYIVYVMFKKNRHIKTEVTALQDELVHYKEVQKKNKVSVINERIYLNNKAVLNSSEILYVKSDGHYVEYYLDSKETPVIDRNSLTGVGNLLPDSHFVRIHKSYIINIERIKIINSTEVMLDNNTWINLSRTYKQNLKDILHK